MPERFRNDIPKPREAATPRPRPVGVAPQPLAMPPAPGEGSLRLGEPGDDKLTQAAEGIGHAVGVAVNAVDRTQQSVRERFTVIRGGARRSQVAERAGEMAEDAVEGLQEAGERAMRSAREMGAEAGETVGRLSARAGEVVDSARQKVAAGYEETRLRAFAFADRQPFLIIASAAGVAFLIGFLLRIGRSARD